ncbi:Melibiose operon regulatory protein [Thalassocella blandensis]|nr:Melibiose operon regulatory protein [Thalassocella blandensis]
MSCESTVLQKPSYELINPQEASSVLYREHGFPHPLVRWHYHKEYELHLITHSSGKIFVGDYIGNFHPNHLVLTGPNLPHNWITQSENNEFFPKRDKVVTFTDELVQSARAIFPEFQELDGLLHRSCFGIEFLQREMIDEVHSLIDEIASSKGMLNLATFIKIMSILANNKEYKLLSSSQYSIVENEKQQTQVDRAVNFIVDNYQQQITQEDVADHLSMTPTYFSRFFRRATGRRFVEFINSLRIARACDLISHSDEQITNICFNVGFNNIANFNRHFFTIKGMTPTDYRKSVHVPQTPEPSL